MLLVKASSKSKHVQQYNNNYFDTLKPEVLQGIIGSVKWVCHVVGVSCSTVRLRYYPLGQIYAPTTFQIKPTPLCRRSTYLSSGNEWWGFQTEQCLGWKPPFSVHPRKNTKVMSVWPYNQQRPHPSWFACLESTGLLSIQVVWHWCGWLYTAGTERIYFVHLAEM